MIPVHIFSLLGIISCTFLLLFYCSLLYSLQDRFRADYVCGQDLRVPLFAAAHHLGGGGSQFPFCVRGLDPVETRARIFNSPRAGMHLLPWILCTRTPPRGCAYAQASM
jgi:hypothetical protein